LRSPVARRAHVTAALISSSLILAALAPAVSASNGLEVTTPFTAVSVAPGNKVSFDLTITSTRDANVDLSLSGVPTGWTASIFGGGFVVDGVAVTPDAPAKVRLDVTVPADAQASTATVRVLARGGGAEDTLPIAVRVNAEAAGDLTLTTNTPELTGASDKSFKFDLQFKNDTAQDVTVSAAATGPDGWTVDATLTGATDAASTVVKAGSTQSISVSAKAPEGAAADTYPIKVTATAGDRSVEADLSIAVTGSYSMTLATAGGRPLSTSGSAGSPTTMSFEVKNTGTAPITQATLEGTPPNGWKVTVDPADGVATIAPDQTATINATITPSNDAVAGDYVVTFKTASTEDTTGATAQIRFTVETSPIWLVVGVGLILLILAGLYYVFRTYGRR
jgi:uncharacterized membrane protein